MEHFLEGNYLGINKNELPVGGLILSETVYEEGFTSDWHTHENPYFAFVMDGGCIEKRREISMECTPANLLFYNGDEPHKNFRYQPHTKIFNVEFKNAWLDELDIRPLVARGAIISNPDIKFLLLKIMTEFQSRNRVPSLGIEAMAIRLISLINDKEKAVLYVPAWAARLKEMLQDCWQENYSLKELASAVGVHPVTISKYFPRYFNCNLEEYIRKIRIDRSLTMIRAGKTHLTTIAHQCGFADQSHFIRVFKKQTGLLPNYYRSI